MGGAEGAMHRERKRGLLLGRDKRITAGRGKQDDCRKRENWTTVLLGGGKRITVGREKRD